MIGTRWSFFIIDEIPDIKMTSNSLLFKLSKFWEYMAAKAVFWSLN